MIERFIVRIQATDIVKLNFSDASAMKCTFHVGKLMQYSQVSILHPGSISSHYNICETYEL